MKTSDIYANQAAGIKWDSAYAGYVDAKTGQELTMEQVRARWARYATSEDE